MASKAEMVSKIVSLTGHNNEDDLYKHSEKHIERLTNVLARPDIFLSVNRTLPPFTLKLTTPVATINLNADYSMVDSVFINGAKFEVKDRTIDGLEQLVSDTDSIKANLGEQIGRTARGRRARRSRRRGQELDFETMQEYAFDDLKAVRLSYATLYGELSGLLLDSGVSPTAVMDEVMSHKVEQEDLAYFLTHESTFKESLISRVNNVAATPKEKEYHFTGVQKGDGFIGQLLESLNVDEALYDQKEGTLKIGERLITNLPHVDEKGVFSNGSKRYIPYHTAYFAEGEGSRVERLRHVDPVKNALDAIKLQYELTEGDIKFKSILDVTRNLPDFEKHPKGDIILETLKKKVVLDNQYSVQNSLHAEFHGRSNELGAVAMTMLDDDAKGLIDPLGTSNGANLGRIFYLTADSDFNEDGTFKHGTEEHSLVGQYMSEFFIDKDNFNRNQMSFNAFLTSTDIKELNVAFMEAGMFNAEDGKLMTKNGAMKFQETDPSGTKVTGDKLQDFHGNKGVVPLVIDPDMSDTEAAEKQLTNLVQLARSNPDLDIIESPISIASRLNMGVIHEGLGGKKQDLHLPDGTVIKDGITSMVYMGLPQTAEHKSKDYSIDGEGAGRKYSSLVRHALSSKIGEDLYNRVFMDEGVRSENVERVVTAFQRLGVTFKDESRLIEKGNIYGSVDAPVTVSMDDLATMTPMAIRRKLTQVMSEANATSVNIDMQDIEVTSPLTQKPIEDQFGRNVVPIRVSKDENISYRYNDLFKHIANQNVTAINSSYQKAVSHNYSQLVRKDNILKDIDTMTIKEGTHTDVIVPDPRLGLTEVRVNMESDQVIVHRDPAIQSSNVITMNNVGGGDANVMHINPLVVYQQQGDFDGDTEGVTRNDPYNRLTTQEKEDLYYLSNTIEQLNYYGDVNLPVHEGSFKALAMANGLDTSSLTFDDGKSNTELARLVEGFNKELVNSPKSYGAYAVSFENEDTAKQTLGKLAEDGIKGSVKDIHHHFEHGYDKDENQAVMKALIAKSEWTGLAGSITNNVIANMGDKDFDPGLIRCAFDITQTMSQSVLQMKKNANMLPVIDGKISDLRKVISGNCPPHEARGMLKMVTEGLIPEKAVDTFVDMVNDRQDQAHGVNRSRFGNGVINGNKPSTATLSYQIEDRFTESLNDLINKTEGLTR